MAEMPFNDRVWEDLMDRYREADRRCLLAFQDVRKHDKVLDRDRVTAAIRGGDDLMSG